MVDSDFERLSSRDEPTTVSALLMVVGFVDVEAFVMVLLGHPPRKEDIVVAHETRCEGEAGGCLVRTVGCSGKQRRRKLLMVTAAVAGIRDFYLRLLSALQIPTLVAPLCETEAQIWQHPQLGPDVR